MFVCHKCCADVRRCTGSLFGGSHGRCEICGEVEDCCDCPKHLQPTWTDHAKDAMGRERMAEKTWEYDPNHHLVPACAQCDTEDCDHIGHRYIKGESHTLTDCTRFTTDAG